MFTVNQARPFFAVGKFSQANVLSIYQLYTCSSVFFYINLTFQKPFLR